MDWSNGTQVVIDQASRGCYLEAKDPMFGHLELQTPFRIDSNSPFMTTTGTADVTDGDAANGKCVQLDAQNELLGLYYANGATRMNKYLSRGKYLVTVYAKDTTQLANDLRIRVQSNEGGTHYINTQQKTLQSGYNAIPYDFTLESSDVGDAIIISMTKMYTGENVISIDYMTIEQIGTDYHQSLSGGQEFLYFADASTLPTASKAFRGVMA